MISGGLDHRGCAGAIPDCPAATSGPRDVEADWHRNRHHQLLGARLTTATRPLLPGRSHPQLHSDSGRAAKGFQVLPRRWVVERTFGWLSRCRRLARDYERRTDHAEAMIQIAMIRLMAARLAGEELPEPRSDVEREAARRFADDLNQD
ncbi:transposase [Actinomycetospora lutea]|nr:transposase [Actinomycetospora lutea]MDD7942818.1 transposase [Actinomycetospora lutea]